MVPLSQILKLSEQIQIRGEPDTYLEWAEDQRVVQVHFYRYDALNHPIPCKVLIKGVRAHRFVPDDEDAIEEAYGDDFPWGFLLEYVDSDWLKTQKAFGKIRHFSIPDNEGFQEFIAREILLPEL